jgi:hypothetical protein
MLIGLPAEMFCKNIEMFKINFLIVKIKKDR